MLGPPGKFYELADIEVGKRCGADCSAGSRASQDIDAVFNIEGETDSMSAERCLAVPLREVLDQVPVYCGFVQSSVSGQATCGFRLERRIAQNRRRDKFASDDIRPPRARGFNPCACLRMYSHE